MSHPARGWGWIADRDRSVDGADPPPKHPHRQFGVEVEAAGGRNCVHDGNGGGQRIEAKPKERIFDASAEGFKMGEPIADASTAHAFGWSVWAEDGHA